MTGVQTCALPICFPVTISVVHNLSLSKYCKGQSLIARSYYLGKRNPFASFRGWREHHAKDRTKVTEHLVAYEDGDSILNSAVLDDDFIGPADVDLPVGVDDKVTASEIDATMRTWQFQRANGLTPMDYEDWLATYGIVPQAAENHRPELLRYVREWQYPSNTVDPSTGVSSSAVSWAVAERADKDRF